MKTIIYYFSGTGNSLMIARSLAEAIGGAEVVSIPSVIGQEKIAPQADNVGIVFPVYMFGAPLMVSKFIKKLEAQDKYIFAIANYGGTQGAALKQIKDELEACGMKLSSGFGLVMPANYTPFGGAMPQEKQKAIFKKEKEKIDFIAHVVMGQKEERAEVSNPLMLWIGKFVFNYCKPKINGMDKDFWTDEKCSGCGICERVCPVSNIVMENGKPKWCSRCEQCFACLQWCPEAAIQCGKQTQGKKRYHHPEVSINDFFMK